MSLNQMRTMSDDIKLSGDINQNLSSMSGDIKVRGNFGGNSASTMSGDIRIKGNNTGNLQSASGDIKLINNQGAINTASGDIELEKNFGDIVSMSGDIEVEENKGSINTTSGDIEVEENTGKLKTLAGEINIGNIKISIKRAGVSINNVGDVFSGRSQSIVSGSNVVITGGTQSVSIINGKVTINGVEVGASGNSSEEVYKVYIDNLTVDFIKKAFYINDIEVSLEKLNSSGSGKAVINNNTIIISYEGQDIAISKDGITIQG